MGSDLHMSPPTPDEYRIVRAGDHTAVYSRHTDGIYGDTLTWTRKHFIEDPTEVAFVTLQATHSGWDVVTLTHDVLLAEKLPYDTLATPDRDYEAEVKELRQKAIRARERATLAFEEAVMYEAQALAIEAEREKEART